GYAYKPSKTILLISAITCLPSARTHSLRRVPRSAARGFGECAAHHFVNVTISRDTRLQTLASRSGFFPRGLLTPLPVNDGNQFFLARSQRQAVEQITQGIAVGIPDLLKVQ